MNVNEAYLRKGGTGQQLTTGDLFLLAPEVLKNLEAVAMLVRTRNMRVREPGRNLPSLWRPKTIKSCGWCMTPLY
jgi:hypothetical protein